MVYTLRRRENCQGQEKPLRGQVYETLQECEIIVIDHSDISVHGSDNIDGRG